jgi:hypothetical protein
VANKTGNKLGQSYLRMGIKEQKPTGKKKRIQKQIINGIFR